MFSVFVFFSYFRTFKSQGSSLSPRAFILFPYPKFDFASIVLNDRTEHGTDFDRSFVPCFWARPREKSKKQIRYRIYTRVSSFFTYKVLGTGRVSLKSKRPPQTPSERTDDRFNPVFNSIVITLAYLLWAYLIRCTLFSIQMVPLTPQVHLYSFLPNVTVQIYAN